MYLQQLITQIERIEKGNSSIDQEIVSNSQ